MKTKITPIILLVFISVQICKAQTQPYYQYDYDASGNRIHRILTMSPRLAAPTDSIKEFKDNIANHEVKLFPNPTKGEIKIEIKGYEAMQQSKAEVYDMQGKLVFSRTALTEFTSIDLSSQPNGNYFLRIFVNKEMREWKVVKTE